MTLSLTAAEVKKLPKLAEGGEAAIYDYGKEVIKIFHPKTRIHDKEAKIKNLLNSGLRAPGLVMPTNAVEINGKFMGYTMPRINDANPLHDFTKARFVKTEQLTNLDALQIVASIGKTMDTLHGGQIVIGDVSDNNFMASIKKPHNVYFIDIDSWGMNGLSPDAYTETFVPPESYGPSSMRLDAKTDQFGYSILAFNVLTRLHPFYGTYTKDDRMSVTDRIKNSLSVLGSAKKDIVINKAIPSWEWMSPDLLDGFLKSFERGKRDSITPLIEDQLKHSKKCPIHGVYYYDRFADCPLCSGEAKIVVVAVPTIKPTTGDTPTFVLIFEDTDVRLMLGKDSFISVDGDIVYRPNGRRVHFAQGRTHFAANGRFAVNVDNHSVRVHDVDDKEICNIPRAYNSSYALNGVNLFYVDQNDIVCQLTMTTVGLSSGQIQQSNNPLLSANSKGEVFIIARYPDRLLVTYGGRDIEIMYPHKIKEYTIKYDIKSATWAFILELPNGKHRTIIFGNKGIEYDSDIIRYNATPLSNLCYYAGTIYGPGNGEIIGANLAKNTAKKFPCSIVNAESALEFEEGGFNIVTEEKLYRFG